jgi:hypothetical protein
MEASGIYLRGGYTLAQLQTKRAECDACITAILANQSYSMSGRSFTRADLDSVMRLLGEINYAIDVLSGNQTIRFVHADMSNG